MDPGQDVRGREVYFGLRLALSWASEARRSCKPAYYAFRRLRDGRVEKSKRVRTRTEAQKKVNEWRVEIDQGRLGLSAPKNPPFNEWADEFEKITEKRVDAGDLKRSEWNERGRRSSGWCFGMPSVLAASASW